MQGSDFNRRLEDTGPNAPAPPPLAATPPEPGGLLALALQHQQLSLQHLETASRQVARQQVDLQAVRQDVVAVSQRQRERIGHDLQDVLGQSLTALALLARLLERRFQERGAPEIVEIRQIHDLAASAMRQTRELAHGLPSEDVRAEDLVPALAALAQRTRQTRRVGCLFEPPRNPGAVRSGDVSTHLYHVAREAVANAVRHGRPRHIQLALHSRTRSLVLIVQDDGCGFRPTGVGETGIGLKIMEHRACLVGGTLSVESQPGKGTTLTCTVPMIADDPLTKGPSVTPS